MEYRKGNNIGKFVKLATIVIGVMLSAADGSNKIKEAIKEFKN